ncbi:MAG: hypothetical protein CMM46_15275 [Rhodospirillaceae bacterium]|nr:hypothetical protein [Rhodospirillaceae bacterium]
MKEILCANNLGTLAFAQALLKDTDIPHEVFDQHTSMLEGSIMAIQRRLLVLDDGVEQALTILNEADIGGHEV